MNKAKLIEIMKNTCCNEFSRFYDPWCHLMNELGLPTNTPTISDKPFNDSFIKANFPTVERFLNKGHEFKDGDYFLGASGGLFKVSNSATYNLNKKYDNDYERYVIFAQCWFDDNNNERPVVTQVMDDLIERLEKGIGEYGQALRANNGRKSLQDAYEEALDLACYLKQAINERK